MDNLPILGDNRFEGRDTCGAIVFPSELGIQVGNKVTKLWYNVLLLR